MFEIIMDKQEIQDKRILRLQLPTDPRWVNMAEISIEYILTDHAYCEMKAASQCISLISRYNDKPDLVEQLSPIVTEEWGHFRMVLKEIEKRGFTLGPQRKDLYVNKLKEFENNRLEGDRRLVEKLIIFALIEARSCERFRLLSLNISDPSLKDFYHKLMISEASHYKLFIALSKKYESEEYVINRWNECLAFEAEVMATMDIRGDRVH
jgi:tRNA 2-(methylsulfanyl)-N6-isopentenyladenosine37 hydroxylase